MVYLLLLALASTVISLIVTPLVRNYFKRIGRLDRPNERKTHPSPVPRVGGIAVVIAYALSIAIVVVPSSLIGVIRNGTPAVLRILPAALIIFVVGLLDDLLDLRAYQKLLGILVACAVAIAAGVNIHGFAGHHFPMWIGIPLTVLWLVGCTNAFNLIDGVDGLATGAGLFATVTMLIAGRLQTNQELVIMTIPLAGALLGFLRYNFNPASIFLGDCGSLLIGFLLGCFGILWSQKSATMLGMTAPLMALSLPLLDTLISMARRFIRGKSILSPDREHIHHKLLDRGLSPKRVALLLYSACGFSAVLSLLLNVNNNRWAGLVLVLFCVAVWVCVQHLGYAEFRIAGQMVIAGVYTRLVNSQLALQGIQKDLTGAGTIEELWEILRRSYRIFGFHQVELKLGDDILTDRSLDGGICAWVVSIPISHSASISLTRRADASASEANAAYIEIVRTVLSRKLQQLRFVPHVQREPERVAAIG